MKLGTLCYIQHNNSYLMIHRNKRKGDIMYDMWNGVGGKFQENETPEECAIREVKEETGLVIANPQLKGIITFPNNLNTGEVWYVFVYIAKEFKGSVKESEEGRLEWISIQDIPQLQINYADKHFMKWLEKDTMFSAKFHYVGDELKDFRVVFY